MHSPRHALAALEEVRGHGLTSNTSYFIMLFAFFNYFFIIEVSPRMTMAWTSFNLCKTPCISPRGQSPSVTCPPRHNAV